MNILLVEDDQNKVKQIVEFINSKIKQVNINKKFSYQSGLKEILRKTYDLIILDMSMPTFDISPQEDGGRPRHFAGKDILRQMHRRKIEIPVIVVTQYERLGELSNTIELSALCKELEELYGDTYIGTVYYNPALNNWKEDFFQLLTKACKKEQLND